jgi:methylmalonyl-CoA/ethylmalonyl-CoA epimerase
MVGRLDHIGIAVKDLERAVATYARGLGLEAVHRETVADQAVNTAFLPLGETRLELLESTSPDGPIGRFVARRGEGIHHLCFAVDDIRAALERCKAAGMVLIDQEPRVGAHDTWVAFVHPRSTHGVLIELSQDRTPGKEEGGGAR